MNPVIVEVTGLRVRYGARVALDDVSISARPGITAVLGPNGAGKTTLFAALTGRRPHAGSVTIAGHDLAQRRDRRAARAVVGYLPQRFDLSGSMTVRATVAYAGWCHGLARRAALRAADEALAVTELTGKADDKVRTISGGERQRLGLACAIAHRPQVLLLDEPTVGLDPDQRVRFRQFLQTVSSSTCVLVSTHLLEDVSVMGNALVVLSAGRVAYAGDVDGLVARGQAVRTADETAMEAGYRHVLRSAEATR